MEIIVLYRLNERYGFVWIAMAFVWRIVCSNSRV